MLFIFMTVESSYQTVYVNKVWQNRDQEGDVLVICPLHVERIGMPADISIRTQLPNRKPIDQKMYSGTRGLRGSINLFEERPT